MKKQTLLLTIVLVLIVGGIFYLEKTDSRVNSFENDPLGTGSSLGELKEGLYPMAPELTGIAGYLNTDGEEIKISDYKGKVVLIDFWTYSCINCIRTLPYITEWDRKYRDDGLVIIGVHTPEFDFEKKYENVEEAIEKYNIEYPVVQDNDYATWSAYKNSYWPRKYIIDADGFIRYDHIGEGAYQETEEVIQTLLEESGQKVSEDMTELEDKTPTTPNTPELYAGYGFALTRGQDIGNPSGLIPDEITSYTFPSEINNDIIYLDGSWQSNNDDLELKGNAGSIALNFVAKSANIVGGTSNSPIELEVFIDGVYATPSNAGTDVQFDGDRAFILVETPDLYNVYNDNYARRLLELRAQKGFYFNAFTFG